jgi:hypothetical protein
MRDRVDQDLGDFDRRNHPSKCIIRFSSYDPTVEENED